MGGPWIVAIYVYCFTSLLVLLFYLFDICIIPASYIGSTGKKRSADIKINISTC